MPNFLDPVSRANITVIPCAGIVAVMILFVFLRMYTKIYITHSTGWDDCKTKLLDSMFAFVDKDPEDICILVTLFSIAYLGLLMDIYQRGFGVHQWDISVARLNSLLAKEVHANTMLWGPILFSTKLALLLLFWRLFHSTAILRYMIYLGVAFHFALYTSYMFLSFFLCPQTFAMKCLNQLNMLFILTTSLNISGDFYLLFLPIFAVARLHIPTRFKLSLVAVFSTGLLACVASILALYFRARLRFNPDITWNSTPVFIFTVLEINCGIVVCCMPTFPALFRHWNSPPTARTYHYRRSAIQKSFPRNPAQPNSLPTILNPGIARAQCATCADQYRAMEEGRVAQSVEREVHNVRQARPVQSFFLDATPDLSSSASH